MNRKLFSITLICLLLVAASVTAQEKLSVSESMKWLPDGIYFSYGNYNVVQMEKQPSYEFFKMLMNEDDDRMMGEAPPLPKSFDKHIEYISFARTRIIGSEEELQAAQNQMREKSREIRARAEKGKGGQVGFSKKDRDTLNKISEKIKQLRKDVGLWVFKIRNLPDIMKKEIKGGNFARIGKRIFKKPVYTFNEGVSKGKATNNSKTFAYATDTGELLVCSEFDSLKAMIQSGNGTASNIFDNQEYAVCVNYLENRGQVWKVKPGKVIAQNELEKMRARGDEDTKIQAKEEAIEKKEVFKIDNMILSEEVDMQSISVFMDADAAKTHYEKTNTMFKETSASLKGTRKQVTSEIAASGKELSRQEERMVKSALGFAGNLLEGQSTILEDSVVTTTIKFGKKQMKTLSMLLRFAKTMEAMEEKKELRIKEREEQ